MSSDDKNRRHLNVHALGLRGLVGVIVVWALGGLVAPQFPGATNLSDTFAPVNALFSALAFGGVFYAILLQYQQLLSQADELEVSREDLKLTRDELTLTRRELAEQNAALIAQNETMQLQSFESTFFQLLRLQNDIVAAIDLTHFYGDRYVGRECFRAFYDELKRGHESDRRNSVGQLDLDLDQLNHAYIRFFSGHQGNLGHYFRSLYHLVKFVDRSVSDSKGTYTNLIRAQLSTYELALLFYNGLSELGREKFKPLIEKYGLLKNLPPDVPIDHGHREHYAESAFRGWVANAPALQPGPRRPS